MRARTTSWVVPVAVCSMLAVIQAQPTEYELLWSSTNAQVRQFLGNRGGRMVYVNVYTGRKALHFIDFSEGDGDPVIHRIAAARDPTAPVPSPDGRWVAYASAPGVNGESGTPESQRSSVYLCRLAEGAQPVLVAADSGYEPRFLWESDSLTVVFPTLAPNCAWEGIGQTVTVTIDTTAGVAVPGARRVLCAHGGYTAGISANMRYLGGGGRWVAMIDLQSGATRPDTVANPYTAQACNASITSSRRKQDLLMYLDFGTATGLTVPPEVNGGRAWGQWNLIWVSDGAGVPVSWYHYPASPAVSYLYEDPYTTDPSPTEGTESFRSATWHHPEWSNHAHYAACAVAVERAYRRTGGPWYHTQQQERGYLVNLRTGENLEVSRRKNMGFVPAVDSGWYNGVYWPTLWVEGDAATFEDEWLAVDGSHAGCAPAGGRAMARVEDRLLTSTQPVRSVTVYSLLGSVVEQRRFAGGVRRAALQHRPAGVYLVQADAAGGGRGVLRWTVSDR